MNFIKSLLRSFKNAFTTNEEIQKLGKKYPRVVGLLKRRLDRTKFTGLSLTIFGIAFLYISFLFLGAISDFITSDIIVQADARVNALLYAFRNITAVKTFIWVTLLGESPTIIVFALVISILLWLSHKKWQAITLWLTIIGSEGFTFIAKLIFHRPRPINAVFLEDSNSFPSGHATIAVAFYGFLAYLLFKKTKSKLLRALIILVAIITIAAIGFSRLYLGVHYVSDVWTGYLVGLLWLIIGITIAESKLFQTQDNLGKQNLIFKYKKTISSGLIAAALIFYISYGFVFHPKFLPQPSITQQATVTSTINIFSDFNIPRYTETLTGETQEPISFIISAKDDFAIRTSFEKAGWFVADTINFHSIKELLKYSISNKEYPAAPMTPSFWNKQVHNLGFEKMTETKSVRQRHHARFWKTNLKTSQGEAIYVGTASLDIGIKWLITHKISPDIDTERELLFTDLQKIGAIKSFEKTKLINPVLGKNFSGDPFFTDGKAYFIELNQ